VTDRLTGHFAAPSRTLTLDDELGITFALFRERALQLRAFHSRSISWSTGVRNLADCAEPIASGRNSGSETRVVMLMGAVCHVRICGRWVAASLASPPITELDSPERELRIMLPCSEPGDLSGSSMVRFWYRRDHGAESIARRIPVPEWSEIRTNYPGDTSDHLDLLMDCWRPGESGQLLLWHGPPGTGKTYALRALAGSWAKWCEPQYIVDPEVFFGQRPDYMLEVLLDQTDEDRQDATEQGTESRQNWRLLILEDTGELLAADAKERGGRGLSRLLNLVDGLIGQRDCGCSCS
jgi:ATPase family associated with various cellular activities (AAA)